LRESLIPVLFGGRLHVELNEEKAEEGGDTPMREEGQDEEEKKEEEKQPAPEHISHDTYYKFADVVCGSRQTLAMLDRSPFVALFGNGKSVAETFPQHFLHDRPIKYDCAGQQAIILTEKGYVYKVNLETLALEELHGEGGEIGEVKDIACGADYLLAIMDNGHVYGMGNNKSGQLGTGDFNARSKFESVDDLIHLEV